MTEACFVDTNVLVYFRDASEPEKQRKAREWLELLWRERVGRTSFQVLHEYYATVTRKLKPGLPPGEARADVKSFLVWSPTAADQNVLERAWLLQDRYSLAFWDALIAAAALHAECRYLISEDFSDGQDLGGVRVLNPFLHDTAALRKR